MMSKFGIFYTDKEGMKNNDHKKMDFIKTNKRLKRKEEKNLESELYSDVHS